MYVLLRKYNFAAKVNCNGYVEIKIVWSGYNGFHVSQEDVCKLRVALYPIFTDAHCKIRFLEGGLLKHLKCSLH